MNALFGRFCEIVISDGDGEGIDLSQLRAVFTVQRMYGPQLNTLELELYNLSSETRQRMDEDLRTIELRVGYSGGSFPRVGTIFRGDIGNVFPRGSDADTITTIYAADGARAWRRAEVNLSMDSGTSLRQVVSTLARTFGESVRSIDVSQIGDEVLPGPYHATGLTRDALESIVGRGSDYIWGFEDGDFSVTRRDAAPSEESSLVSVETGMVGTPVENLTTISAASLMYPAIRPRESVRIKSQGSQVSASPVILARQRGALGVSGADGSRPLRVLTVVHSGDTRGNEWLTRFEAIKPGFLAA